MILVCVSDTHGHTFDLPDGDVLIHAGDMTNRGYRSETYSQLAWLEANRHRYKNVIITAGNHDFYFEKHAADARKACEDAGINLLINQEIVIDGFKFWGSPCTPWFHNWAFNLNDHQLEENWANIPDDTDVLITHGPPRGILDNAFGVECGCEYLKARIKEVSPVIHIFGHIHEGHGQRMLGNTLCVNVAVGNLINKHATVLSLEKRLDKTV